MVRAPAFCLFPRWVVAKASLIMIHADECSNKYHIHFLSVKWSAAAGSAQREISCCLSAAAPARSYTPDLNIHLTKRMTSIWSLRVEMSYFILVLGVICNLCLHCYSCDSGSKCQDEPFCAHVKKIHFQIKLTNNYFCWSCTYSTTTNLLLTEGGLNKT